MQKREKQNSFEADVMCGLIHYLAGFGKQS